MLSRIIHFRYSPGFPLFWYSRKDFYLLGTSSDPTFPVLTRIPPFPVLARILPFPILTRISPFRYSPGFYLFQYSLGFLFSGTRPDSTISRYSPGPFFGTRSDSTFSAFAGILPFPVLTRIQPFTVLAWTFLQSLPGFPHLLRHRPWISLSFPALCPDNSSSQTSCLVFFKSFNRSDSVPLTFSTR